jgi:hypothetical protein
MGDISKNVDSGGKNCFLRDSFGSQAVAKLCFNLVLQKDKGASGEKFQNRCMSCLDNRVQQVIYSRLKSYGIVDEGHLPHDVPTGVVLNSGGSYLQLTTWEYLGSSRFVTDPDRIHVFTFCSGTDHVSCQSCDKLLSQTTITNGVFSNFLM